MRLELMNIVLTADHGLTERGWHPAQASFKKDPLEAIPSSQGHGSLESSMNNKHHKKILPCEGHKDSTQPQV